MYHCFPTLCPPPPLGHHDGHVRLWDMFGEQPQLLLTAPSAVAARPPGGGPGLRSVTVLELLWEHGVLVTGHAKGEVRVYKRGGYRQGDGRV